MEHRGDGEQKRTAGTAVAERQGLKHWWENLGPTPAQIVVIDIITQE